MRNKKHGIVRELDPMSASGISETERKHYLGLGYKPYLLTDGSTKWLTVTQRVYREAQMAPSWTLKSLFRKAPRKTRYKKRRGNSFIHLLRKNWAFLLIIAASILLIWFATSTWLV